MPTPDSAASRAPKGRPPRTSRSEIARVALRVFLRDGFEQATVGEIAAAVGVSERTVFRYFPTKQDLVWGEFETTLDRLRVALAATSPQEPVWSALTRAVLASNDYPGDELPYVRARMTLIANEPSIGRYSSPWRDNWISIVSEFVGDRLGRPASSLAIRTIAYAGYGAAAAAFDAWVADPGSGLAGNLTESFRHLSDGFYDLEARIE